MGLAAKWKRARPSARRHWWGGRRARALARCCFSPLRGATLRLVPQRELEEEARVRATDARRVGLLLFDFKDAEFSGPLAVHVFRADHIEGEPEETCVAARGRCGAHR